MASVIDFGLPSDYGEVPRGIVPADAAGLFQESVRALSDRMVLRSVGHVPQMGDELAIDYDLHLGSAVLPAVVGLEEEGRAVSHDGNRAGRVGV